MLQKELKMPKKHNLNFMETLDRTQPNQILEKLKEKEGKVRKTYTNLLLK